MARKLNLYVDQGSDYSNTLIAKDSANSIIDLTDYTVAGKVKKTYTWTNATSFSTSIDSNAATGSITITLDANTTGLLVAGRHVYDIEVTSNTGVVTRVQEGILTVKPSVT